MTIQFLIFLIAQAISDFGSAVSSAGLAVIWANSGAPATELAFILAFPALPGLVVTPIIGALMEGAPLKKALTLLNVVMGLIALAMVGALSLPDFAVLSALSVVFILKTFGASAFGGVYNRTFAIVAPQDELGDISTRALAYGSMSHRIGPAVGAIVGTVIALRFGAVVFVLDAFTFFVAALLVLLLNLSQTTIVESPSETSQPFNVRALAREIWNGVLFFKGNNRLIRMFFLYIPMTLCWACWDVIGAYIAIDLGRPEEFGKFLVAAQVGEFLAGAVLAKYRPRNVAGPVMLAALPIGLATLLSGLAAAFMWPSDGRIWLIIGLRVLIGAGSFLAGGGTYDLLVHRAPDQYKSRATALVESIGLGAIFALSRLTVGKFYDVFGSAPTFMTVGIVSGMFVCILVTLEYRARYESD